MVNARPATVTVFALAYFLIFSLIGLLIPYFPLFAESIGLSGTEIGLLIAIGALVRTLTPPLWGYVADRLAARRCIFVLASLATAGAVLPMIWSRLFVQLAFSLAIFHLFMSPLVPFVDAATWERVISQGGDYGRVRLWGSIGFICASLAAGWLAKSYSPGHALAAAAPVALLLALAGTGLPTTRVGARERQKIWRLIPALANKPLRLLFLTAAIMQMSHGAFYAFFSIHLGRLGFDPTAIGLAWAVGVVAEVGLMYFSSALFDRLRPELLLAVAFVVAAVRWWIIAATASLAVILAAQTLHAVTFGAFHIAALRTLHRIVPPSLRTTGQGVYGALSFGFGGSLGMGLSGIVVDHVGTSGLFILSGLVALLGLLPSLALARGMEAFDSHGTRGQVRESQG